MRVSVANSSHLITAQRPLEEFMTDPALTIACVLLVVVSIGWIVVWRLILHDAKKAAMRGKRLRGIKPPRDVWTYPP